MSFIAGYLLGLADSRTPVLTALSVSENGDYSPPDGYDGFSSVTVNVQGGAAKVQSLTVTSNGTYTAPDGVDGYSPVTVNVPSQYDEGYSAGYSDGYSKGKEDGGGSGGTSKYTFPDGTAYSDIMTLVKTDPVTDENLGLTIKIIYSSYSDDDGYVYGRLDFGVYNTSETRVTGFIQDWVITDPDDDTLTEAFELTSYTVDSSSGKVSYVLKYYGSQDGESWDETYNRSETFSQLKGYGSSGHKYSVSNA